MALNIISTPYSGMTSRISPAYNDMVFVMNETEYKERPSFRYIFDVYVDGSKRGQLRHFPDFETGYGVCNVNQICQSYLSHNLNCLSPTFNVVNNAICTYQVKVGSEYSRRVRYTSLDFYTHPSNGYDYLRINFTHPHNLRVGDIVRVTPDNSSINPSGNTNAMRVGEVFSSTSIRVTGNGGYTSGDTVGGWVHEAENFYDNQFSPINGVNYVGFLIPNARPTRLKVGDTVLIVQFGTPTNTSYNGEWKIISIDTTGVSGYQNIIVNCPWGNSSPQEEGMILCYNNYEFTGTTSSPSGSTWAYNGAFQYEEDHKLNVTAFTPYIEGRRFLTNAPKTHNVTSSDYHTLSFLGGAGFNGDYSTILNVETTKEDGTVTHYQYSGTPANDYASSTNDKHIIQEVGVGPANIAALTTGTTYGNSTPVSLTDVVSYKVWLSGIVAGTEGVSTEKVKFNIICPKKYTPIQLAFVNRYGTFDYYTFRLKNDKKIAIERSTFDKKLGKVQSNNEWGYNVGDRGATVYNVNANERINCYSDLLTEEEAIWLEELFTSPEVYHIKNGKLLPIILLNEEIQIGNKDNQKIILYNILFKYAFNKNIQRGGGTASNFIGAAIPPNSTGNGSTGSGGHPLEPTDFTSDFTSNEVIV